ncbi:MAG: hypothetical protein ACPGVK_03595 [Halocynthiibacter sp.]
MNTKKRSQILKNAALIGALAFVASCTQPSAPKDPCVAADRPVTLSNLLVNSVTDAYETCLATVRKQAADALEN